MADRVPQRQSSSSQHSLDRANSSRSLNPDIFSDDFALEPLEVADGFRPSIPSQDDRPSQSRASPLRVNRRTSTGPQLNPDQSIKKPRRHNEGSQLHGRVNSFTLRYDAQNTRLPRRTPSTVSSSEMSDATGRGLRPMSTISNFSIPRTQSPYQGGTGPSHPYGMYPQDISLARSPSVATQSTVRVPERSYNGPSGPTHPYGMYHQDTAEEGEGSPIEPTGPTIPVGFPGLGQQHYRRRLGPDGEDADDIVGPDGHTEQLPPYTRYPDHVPRKGQISRPTSRPTSVVEEQQALASTPINSNQASTNDHVAAERNDPQESAPLSPIPEQANESGSIKEKLTARSKRRLCHGRLPVWAMCGVIFILVLLAAILGGVIGRFVGHRSSRHSKTDHPPDAGALPATDITPATVFATITTTLVDATPLTSVPPNLPTLPTGSFGIPLGNPETQSSSCLTMPNQQPAWECSSRAYLGLNVIPADYGLIQVTLNSLFEPDGPLHYGPQPPVFNDQTSVSLMQDKDDLSAGPAYFFQHIYDKIVVLPEDTFPADPSKRSVGDVEESYDLIEERGGPSRFWYQDTVPGDRPWVCVWNNTVIEGFIYILENTTWASQSNASSIVNSLTASAAPMATYSAPSAATSMPSKRQAPTSWHNPWPSPYPKVIKIEERFTAQNSITPYCQQMQILYDTKLGYVTNNDTGVPVIFNLTEVEPSTKKRSWLHRLAENEETLKKRDITDACQCEWLTT